MSRLRIGDPAPGFDAVAHDGSRQSLPEILDGGPLVLFFYPKDETRGCIAEVCAFRDAYEDFVDAGAHVVGVSSDSTDSHQSFAAHHRLPFPLIPDPRGELRRAYRVPRTFGILPGRVTYVIGADGCIEHVFSSQFRPDEHIAEALRIVRRLRAPDVVDPG